MTKKQLVVGMTGVFVLYMSMDLRQVEAQARPWYRGGVSPLKSAPPAPLGCKMSADGEWKCDTGLRIVKIGTYKTWQCLVMEQLQGDIWSVAPDNKPICVDILPKRARE